MNLHTDVRYSVIERVRISLANPSLETFKAIFSDRYVTMTNDCLCKLLGKENVQPKVSKGVGDRVITECQDVIDVPVSEPVSVLGADAVVDKLPIKTTLQQGLEEWVDKADSSDDKKERKKASEIILSGICQKVPVIDLSECKLTSLPQALRNITVRSFTVMLGPYALDNDSLLLITELEVLSNIYVVDSDEQIVGGVDQIGRYKKLLLTQLDSWSDSERDKGNVLSASAISKISSSIEMCLRKKKEIYIDLMGVNLQHVPSFLAKIPGVKVIDFSGNPQLKKIPDFVFEMKCLKNIYFGGCGLTEIPDEISKLDGLENIIVSDNYIEKIPESVTKLKKLKKLYINNNKIDHLPENMGALEI
ncbi:MAG: hypothetical protein QS748_13580 [Candidatus Endonucleobacter bathymodioli]|uniref:Uncharacterized protein n=1 Tax=Candidatus Endonucleibacter bathymodioli TaxID=539814 RepID=A0AA90NW79_9GAMM|nr:hypothetical protein [Candidatus Endonucleobacter bathymodioli]